MSTTTLAPPKPVAKKTAASAVQKAAAKTSAVAKKTAAKKPAPATGEVMLWDDIVKKYPGYHILLADPVYKPKNALYPIKGELLCKHKILGEMVKHSKHMTDGTAKCYAVLYVKDPKDEKKPRPFWIL
jgi:hypothetical protein